MNLHDEIERAIEKYEQVIHHAASRTRDMIDRLGEVEALSRLIVSPDLQQGFKALRDGNQLDLSFEAVILRHREHFGDDVVEAAQWRLDHPHSLL